MSGNFLTFCQKNSLQTYLCAYLRAYV